MKKTFTQLFLSVSLFAGLGVSAQPTITTAELPVAGTAWITANDTSYLSSILPGGMNANWNYSGLQNHGLDTVVFQSSAGTPYSADFPTANLASYEASSGGWTYFTTNSSGISLNGAYDPTFGTVAFNPSSLFCPVPFTYTNTRSTNSNLQVDFNSGGNNVRVTVASQVNFLADGYGTLVLPNGTHNNVLRIKSTDLSTTTISTELIPGSGIYFPVSTDVSQTTTFRHYKPGTTNSFLLEVSGDSLGTYATGASYLYSTNVGIDEVETARITVQPYPNPATGLVTIPMPELQDEAVIELISMDGRSVTLPVTSLDNRILFNTDVLADGIYSFRLGKLTGRLTVQH